MTDKLTKNPASFTAWSIERNDMRERIAIVGFRAFQRLIRNGKSERKDCSNLRTVRACKASSEMSDKVGCLKKSTKKHDCNRSPYTICPNIFLSLYSVVSVYFSSLSQCKPLLSFPRQTSSLGPLSVLPVHRSACAHSSVPSFCYSNSL
jgi:hypothetical protein